MCLLISQLHHSTGLTTLCQTWSPIIKSSSRSIFCGHVWLCNLRYKTPVISVVEFVLNYLVCGSCCRWFTSLQRQVPYITERTAQVSIPAYTETTISGLRYWPPVLQCGLLILQLVLRASPKPQSWSPCLGGHTGQVVTYWPEMLQELNLRQSHLAKSNITEVIKWTLDQTVRIQANNHSGSMLIICHHIQNIKSD